MAWMTETRKNIIINAVVFGAIAGISALGKAFVDNQPLDFPMVQAVMGAVLTALLLYLQSKSQQLETGARKTTKKPGVKFGI